MQTFQNTLQLLFRAVGGWPAFAFFPKVEFSSAFRGELALVEASPPHRLTKKISRFGLNLELHCPWNPKNKPRVGKARSLRIASAPIFSNRARRSTPYGLIHAAKHFSGGKFRSHDEESRVGYESLHSYPAAVLFSKLWKDCRSPITVYYAAWARAEWARCTLPKTSDCGGSLPCLHKQCA